MRKEILDALKAKFAGVSEKILGRIADRLAKTATTAEEVKTAVDGVTFQQVLDSYGDARATEAQQTGVANYEAKHGLKDGKVVKAEATEGKIQPNGSEEEQIPAWAKALIESNNALSQQVKAMQGEKLSATRREQVTKIISSLPSSVRKAYDRIPLDSLSDEQFETLKGEIATEAAEIAKETATKGAVFGKPTIQGGSKSQPFVSNGGKEATEDEVKAVVDKFGI